jgi:hypothetical protein
MSLRKAINEKYRDCIYDPKSGLGNWRQQVTACAITRCALWPHRLTSKSAKADSGAKSGPEQAS